MRMSSPSASPPWPRGPSWISFGSVRVRLAVRDQQHELLPRRLADLHSGSPRASECLRPGPSTTGVVATSLLLAKIAWRAVCSIERDPMIPLSSNFPSGERQGAPPLPGAPPITNVFTFGRMLPGTWFGRRGPAAPRWSAAAPRSRAASRSLRSSGSPSCTPPPAGFCPVAPHATTETSDAATKRQTDRGPERSAQKHGGERATAGRRVHWRNVSVTKVRDQQHEPRAPRRLEALHLAARRRRAPLWALSWSWHVFPACPEETRETDLRALRIRPCPPARCGAPSGFIAR